MQLVHISHGDRTSIVSVYFAIVPQARNIYATQSADCICPIYQPHITTQSIIERQCHTVTLYTEHCASWNTLRNQLPGLADT